MKQIENAKELEALSHPLRWKIMQMLSKREMHLREIAQALNISPSSTH